MFIPNMRIHPLIIKTFFPKITVINFMVELQEMSGDHQDTSSQDNECDLSGGRTILPPTR